MQWLFWFLGVVGYISLGYWLGNHLNTLYFNSKKNKEVKLWTLLQRHIFFPFSSVDWQDRESTHRKNPSLRDICDVHLLDDYNIEEGALEKYCCVLMFLWPLELGPITLGVLKVMVLCLNFVFRSIKRLLRFRSPISPGGEFDRIKELRDKIDTQSEQLRHKINILEGLHRLAKTDNRASELFFAQTLETLRRAHQSRLASIAKIDSLIVQIRKKDQEVRDFDHVLEAQQMLKDMGTTESNFDEIEERAKKALRELQALSKQAGATSIQNLLAEEQIEVEPLAQIQKLLNQVATEELSSTSTSQVKTAAH